MKTSTLTLIAATTTVPALASSPYDSWTPPGPGDVRGPCPMLNTLTNHGFLPHDGKDFTLADIQGALGDVLGVGPALAEDLFQAALLTNPVVNATTFSLSDLGRHGILEHDGSLSRKDFFFGDPTEFDPETFAETTSYWTADTIDLQMVANARVARLQTSLLTNPQFTLSEVASGFDVGESAAYVMVFGDMEAGTAPRDVLKYFFENERLPTSLGWTPPKGQKVTGAMLSAFMDRVREKSYGNLMAPNPAARTENTKRSIGGGEERPSSGRRGVGASRRLRMH